MAELHFTKSPDYSEGFAVGDRVDVFCDHDFNSERIRDWVEGVVVQVDPKMIAIQFKNNVYLTDGWMVPDRVLWFPKQSPHVRPTQRRRRRTQAARSK